MLTLALCCRNHNGDSGRQHQYKQSVYVFDILNLVTASQFSISRMNMLVTFCWRRKKIRTDSSTINGVDVCACVLFNTKKLISSLFQLSKITSSQHAERLLVMMSWLLLDHNMTHIFDWNSVNKNIFWLMNDWKKATPHQLNETPKDSTK